MYLLILSQCIQGCIFCNRLKSLGFSITCGLIISIFTGCSGAVTPFGVLWTYQQSALSQPDEEELDEKELLLETAPMLESAPRSIPTQVTFTPKRQNLHASSKLKISIFEESKNLEKSKLYVFYNGQDVTRTFLARAKREDLHAEKKITFEIYPLKLPAGQSHDIQFVYENEYGSKTVAAYRAPTCRLFQNRNLNFSEIYEEFSPQKSLLKKIEQMTAHKKINSALILGLIAQESSFNPKALSFAKAMGLTQITPVADEDLLDQTKEWPRYADLGTISYPKLKWFVSIGRINEKNDWRLNSDQSILGGILYAQILTNRWSKKEELLKLQRLYRDPELAHTKVVLASYHSGFTRVQNALTLYGRGWLNSADLREAKKYIQKVFSYCFHFSEGEETSHVGKT